MTTSSPATVHFGVGIDTARYGHHVWFLNQQRETAAPDLPIAESAEGYQKLQKQLEKLHQKHPTAHFHIHLDAGGQYAANLESFLRKLELPKTLSVGQPKRNKDYHRAMFPKRKSDISEAQAMARFAVVELPSATAKTPEDIYALREIASRLESQVKTGTQAINRLHNLLSRVFPELAPLASNLAAGWVLKLLEKFPTPQQIAQATLAALEEIPYVSAEKAEKVRQAAQTSIGSLRGEWAQSLVRQAAGEVLHAQKGQKTLEKLLAQALAALPAGGHSQVATICGIGDVTAAVLVAKIVSIDRFPTADHLVAYFGVFPEESGSGVDQNGVPHRRRQPMSRKGNDLVRRYLFCAAKSAIVHNPAVRAQYARLRARGTRGDVALGHAMAKLLDLVFAVWTTDQPFAKDHYPWKDTVETTSPEFAAYNKSATADPS